MKSLDNPCLNRKDFADKGRKVFSRPDKDFQKLQVIYVTMNKKR